MAKRVAFLVDGFNLYHSLREAHSHTGVCAKWLDLRAFLVSYLPLLGRDAQLGSIHYFSALATHLVPSNPDVVKRHQLFIEALRGSGIDVELGRFKPKNVWCNVCKTSLVRHEEKESDVAIAIRLLELVLTAACDIAVLMTGDTDIAPAIRTVRRLRPTVPVHVILPYRRNNAELQQIASQTYKVKADRYAKYLLADPFVLTDGRSLSKPATW